MSKIIEVTQKHINKGQGGSPSFCPVALALQDHFNKSKKLFEVSVCTESLDIWYEYLTPRSVQRFITKFDAYGKKGVKPFKFRLRSKYDA